MSVDENSFHLLHSQLQLNALLKTPSKALASKSLFIKYTSLLQSLPFRVQAIPHKQICQVCSSALPQKFITLDCSHCICSFTCFKSLVDSQLSGNLCKYSNLSCPCNTKISRPVIVEAYGGQESFSKTLNQISKQFEPKLACPICGSELPASSFITLECDHRYCADCIQMSIEILISEGRVGNEIICPECSKPVEPHIIINLIDAATKEKYDDFLLRSLDAKAGERYVRCIGRPGVNCTVGQFVSVDRDEFVCPVCGAKFCPKCKLNVHPKMTCEQKKIVDNSDNDFVKEQLASGAMKMCPWCNIPVMKDENCKYVTCVAGCNGKNFFCWDCLKKLNSKHEVHQCVTQDVISNRIKGFFKGLLGMK